MSRTVRVDRQGRVVIPQAERERLGLSAGGTLELVPTPEGILLERRRRSTMVIGEDGLPLVTLDDVGQVSNVDAIDGIHHEREHRGSTRRCSSPTS